MTGTEASEPAAGTQPAVTALLAEWRELGEEPPLTPFQVAYRAGIRKCADELEYALRGDETP